MATLVAITKPPAETVSPPGVFAVMSAPVIAAPPPAPPATPSVGYAHS